MGGRDNSNKASQNLIYVFARSMMIRWSLFTLAPEIDMAGNA
jgi:hypothetical protein